MKVKNIAGTSQKTCSCGSWLDHWINFSGQKLPTYCSEKNCTNKPEVGAHVQKDSTIDNDWYIVPLCSVHNKVADSMELLDGIALAPANVSKTCGK